MGAAQTAAPDPHVETLERLFASHRAWVEAARFLSDDANSAVYFTQLPGCAFQLVRDGGRTRLKPGRAADPDLVFRFSPHAVERLSAVGGKVGDFAVELFRLILEPDPDRGVGFRVAARFPRLLVRGYARLLLSAGPAVIAFGALHGAHNLTDLRRLVRESRSRSPESWERGD